ncbi:MAG: HEPN domain-containing protein [Acidimicrobiales bacterium]
MSDRPERLRQEVALWTGWAEENLREARRSAENPDSSPRFACFWAQQAAELAIKAVLVSEDVDPPKMHDLADLAARCKAAEITSLDATMLSDLSAFVVATRYPANAPDMSQATPQILIAMAAVVVDAAGRAIEGILGADPKISRLTAGETPGPAPLQHGTL